MQLCNMKFAVVNGSLEAVDISTTKGFAAYVAYRCRKIRAALGK